MAKRKRLVRGRDWHAWAVKNEDGTLSSSISPLKPRDSRWWVRVKFVEVKP